jgi:hypothetical protein
VRFSGFDPERTAIVRRSRCTRFEAIVGVRSLPSHP